MRNFESQHTLKQTSLHIAHRTTLQTFFGRTCCAIRRPLLSIVCYDANGSMTWLVSPGNQVGLDHEQTTLFEFQAETTQVCSHQILRAHLNFVSDFA